MATPSLRSRLARFTNPGKPVLKPNKPLILANRVGNRRREKGEATCITEMSMMMACWKQNEFRDEACRKEIQDFFDCSSRAQSPAGGPGPGSAGGDPAPGGAGPMELMFAEWEDGERFSFEDSDRFEEDSLCSFISEAESLCQNWRGWRKQSAGPNSPTGGGGGGGSGGTRMR
ncbi:coiled-coil-helix-coiled-coil-helix domain-containing protein 1, partial [Cricetulus griseus]